MQSLIPYEERFFDTLMIRDQQAALAVIESAIDAGFPAKLILLNVVVSSINRIGVMQANREIPLHEVFLIARISDAVIERLSRMITFQVLRPLEDKAPILTVILGSAEGDFHSLGRKIVGTFLKVAGFKVIDLGIDVSAERFVDVAVEHGARVICVSALLLHTAENINDIRACLRERGLEDQIKLVVGGAVFNMDTELYKSVGADGFSPNAYGAASVIKSLVGGAR